MVQKTIHAGIEEGESFWQAFSSSLSQKYDLSSIENFVIGGDGASWVKQAEDSFPNSVFELSKYHILKSLKWALGNDEKAVSAYYEAAILGSAEKLEAILKVKKEPREGEARKRIGMEEKQKVVDILKAAKRIQSKLKEDPEGWLTTHMPALVGPHSSRPWVKVLRELSRIQVAC